MNSVSIEKRNLKKYIIKLDEGGPFIPEYIGKRLKDTSSLHEEDEEKIRNKTISPTKSSSRNFTKISPRKQKLGGITLIIEDL